MRYEHALSSMNSIQFILLNLVGVRGLMQILNRSIAELKAFPQNMEYQCYIAENNL